MDATGDLPSSPSTIASRSRDPSPTERCEDGARRSRIDTIHLTPYSRPWPVTHQQRPGDGQHLYHDPRSSSMQSLHPAESVTDGRRRLLLVYIHGFLGDETSFRSFPAHVHHLLTVTLADTHVVHTKIYPKYKSKRAIEFARDDFSNWLCPHESTNTDIILLGHSMGGILASEVSMLPPYSPQDFNAFRHRILGTINFDTPFLGMHPGVIISGIGSLFRASPEPPKEPEVGAPDYMSASDLHLTESTTTESAGSSFYSSYFSSPTSDPNFDPPFPNDVRMEKRTGWDNAIHFISKHSDGLTRATKQYVTSHLEFGGCLADYPGLHKRYDQLRPLEDIDMQRQPKDHNGRLLRRVRFLNYYTASTGRLKSISPKLASAKEPKPVEIEMRDMRLSTSYSARNSPDPSRESSRSPRISLEEHRDGQVVKKHFEHSEESSDEPVGISMEDVSPKPNSSVTDSQGDGVRDPPQLAKQFGTLPSEATQASSQSPVASPFMESLPPIPPLPSPPPEFDPTPHMDKDTLKLAKKEYAARVKAYERSKKDRENAIRDRQKLLEKREKAARKEEDKHAKLEKKQKSIEEKVTRKRQATLNPEAYDKQLQQEKLEADTRKQNRPNSAGASPTAKKQRDRKFCVLPPKGPDGTRDSKWVRVFMEGVDEVGAHCGLFFMSETYERLVGDVAGRIEEWIREDLSQATVWSEREKEMGNQDTLSISSPASSAQGECMNAKPPPLPPR